jgi:hypothetical protein
MRYTNWDVLLFPHGSKTPMQEFRTQCFVTRDNGRTQALPPDNSLLSCLQTSHLFTILRSPVSDTYLMAGL